jgi:hypothetical protein
MVVTDKVQGAHTARAMPDLDHGDSTVGGCVAMCSTATDPVISNVFVLFFPRPPPGLLSFPARPDFGVEIRVSPDLGVVRAALWPFRCPHENSVMSSGSTG